MTCLYLDMNVYNRPFDDQSQMRIQLETVAIIIIFALIETGVLSARWSFILEYENSRNPSFERKALACYLSQSCDNTVEPDESIRKLAKQLSETHGVRGRDALYLACADLSNCDYLVTCDDRLIRRGQRLRKEGVLRVKVVNPVDLVQEV